MKSGFRLARPEGGVEPDDGLAHLAPDSSHALWSLRCALPDAPYLARLVSRHGAFLETLAGGSFGEAFERVCQTCRAADDDAMARTLRAGKERVHLLVAAADLSLVWDWQRVTVALSDFADLAISCALRSAGRAAAEKGWIDWDGIGDVPGLFVMALGKLGARELNYSSDVDLACFHDSDLFPATGRSAGDGAARIVKAMARTLEDLTEDGYVFRVDLRLRPDPRSTNLSVSTQAAERYYESIGQNWERMVWIKARPNAGDRAAATDFLAQMRPFVWRRHLDYWAIGDIHAIKRQIHAQGNHGDLARPDFDVKLGRGGIREIEFFVQTQQLILGGRRSELRARTTLEGLDLLTEAGVVDPDAREELRTAYGDLRGIEHRIQMVNDEQTHTLPEDDSARARVARLCGYGTLDDFDKVVRPVRARVHHHYSDLFAEEERLSGEVGNLVFTGVDDDPGTLKTLEGLGFSDPGRVIERVRRWHRGGIKATRTGRGRQILTVLTPRLLSQMAETGEPDVAFGHFADFLEGLASGVQTLSLLLAEEALCQALIETFTLSQVLARDFSRQPETIDALLQGGFGADVAEDSSGFLADIPRAGSAESFETAMNGIRRAFREERFRIGFQMLNGRATPEAGGQAFATLAETCIEASRVAAEREMARKMGPPPAAYAICGFGKLGSGNLTVASDLDLILVYDDCDAEARTWFTRYTQRLITALSAPTEEGDLYEVDTQLRPSGRAGPVAVQLSAFDRYYDRDAWTWELMALTRFRPLAGDRDLRHRLETLAREKLLEAADRAALRDDAADMRRRLAADRPGKSEWDVKLCPGGLVDIEFIAQYLQLRHGAGMPEVLSVKTEEALRRLGAAGYLTQGDADTLVEAHRFQMGLQHLFRLSLGKSVATDEMSEALKRRVASFAGCDDLGGVIALKADLQGKAARLRADILGLVL